MVGSGFVGNELLTVGAGHDSKALAGIKRRLLQVLRVVQPKARQNSAFNVTLVCSACNALVKITGRALLFLFYSCHFTPLHWHF